MGPSIEPDRLGAVEAVRQGLDEMEAGLGRPAEEVLDELRNELQIPRDVNDPPG